MRMAKVQGIDVRVHGSFWLLAIGYGLVCLLQGGTGALFSGILWMIALFTSVVLHEFGHALMARRFGIETAHITLYPFGGIAALRGEPEGPGQEALISLAGPAVNLGLMVLSIGLWAFTGWMPLLVFGALNVVMGLFNMLPAFPMDGGRVLRASLTPLLGYWKASRFAINLGRFFGIAILVLGVVTFSLNALLIGGFLIFASSVERRRLEARRSPIVVDGWVQSSSQAGARHPYMPRWRVSSR
jgi:stage IV sporulation protein FB